MMHISTGIKGMDEMTNIILRKHVSKLLGIIVSMFLIGYFLESVMNTPILDTYFEITTELLPIGISFSIFVITWYSYRKNGDNYSLFMGAAFLITGLLDFNHMLSYPFMPAFFTPNTPQKLAFFLSESILITALSFLGSAYVYKNTLPWLINRYVLLSFTIIFYLFSVGIVFLYPSRLPVMFLPDGRPSLKMTILILGTVAVMIYTTFLYAKRLLEEEQKTIYLIYGFITIIFSYALYTHYGYSGHLLKSLGFYFLFLALYISSIEKPYEKLTEAETKLRWLAEDRYMNLVDNANDAIITTDLDGSITSWNRSAQKIFGWTLQEVLGKKFRELLVPPEKQDEYKKKEYDTLCEKSIFAFETEYPNKNGKKIDVDLTISPMRDVEKNIIGFSHIIRDVTEHKKAQEIHLENMGLALEIKARSQFLTDMSHDLGTPLNAIIGFSELMKQKIPGTLNEKQAHYVDNIQASASRMLDIINDILDLGKAETGKISLSIEKIPLQEVMEETLNLVTEKTARHNVILKREFDPGLDTIETDRERFKQILFNLVSNAVKYSKHEGGVVTIMTKKDVEMARISISDTGIGIKEENMDKLFKSFEQLDLGLSSKYGSTGLGLVVTKKLVELHGGKIFAESKYGVGSTFTIILPIHSQIIR